MGIWVVSAFWLLWIMFHTIYVFIWAYIFSTLRYKTRCGIARYVWQFCLTFWGNMKLYMAMTPFIFLSATYEGSSFSVSLSVFVIMSFDCSHLKCVMESYGFDLHFLITNNVECFFMFLLCICISSLTTIYSSPLLTF